VAIMLKLSNGALSKVYEEQENEGLIYWMTHPDYGQPFLLHMMN
jgi:hypothetical protein